MTKQIRFNAFEMNCVAHQSPGLWRHPRDRSWQYKDIEYWTDLAQILEKGIFDGIFIADVLGTYDVFHGDNRHALQGAVQVPVNDPLQLAPAMAAVTKHLGFGITTSISFEHPYPFARRITTLDHLTKGRAGWNIVTSYLSSGAKNIGQDDQVSHDDRYDIADEYLEVLYKLWQGSWQDDAVVRDRESGIFTHADKVFPIEHEGKYFKVPGIHISEPSPQRTPVLYQAGASSRGKNFAAKHAECIFISVPSKVLLKRFVDDTRQRLQAEGRDPNSVYIYTLATIITGATDQEAQDKLKEYQKYASHDGALTLVSGWSGVDFSQFGKDDRIQYIKTNAIQSLLESYSTADPSRSWTVDEVAEWTSIGGNGPVFVGSAATIADVLQEWVEETGVDGFNLAYAVAHETFSDVVEYVVPELQKRGVYPQAYREGTLRHKLFGQGDHLSAPHIGASYKR
ncbi:MAG: LLM class flavin-dependent oxidoreductase [Acinetobacter populi]|jgi:FMN-dependent oxidoreductase (nitrilotriacetate monooxygenase family)|uniref:LLM class flavin-dependent oxidoreductase n=1 Tax=Acinetobacter populi TaxID=1582270 RepID=UPI002355403E|nr:LLM class flavin-dependent oxidoreductase [Acinetobacter populi]MCH4249117.1 LLM class flavin-dependent oxidoreductase [Acinetobacter populi]